MISVDTSVWIDFFRGQDPTLIESLNKILDEDQVALAAPVRVEIISGASKKTRGTLTRLLDALPVFYPSETTWFMIENWIDQGLTHGERFGALDLLIAAISKENGAALWSLDHDFRRMKKLGWIDLMAP